MPLTERQKKHLRTLGHQLHPVVMIGAGGLSDGVLNELEGALTYHELVKVKIAGAEREQKKAMIAELAAHSGAEVVQVIGHVALLFRRNPKKPRIELPH